MSRSPVNSKTEGEATVARLETPILLLVFNRPETTRAVMERIRAARPRALYVAADGPRREKVDEGSRCAEARAAATNVDWECDVHTLFRSSNLGCGLAVSSAITWFLEQEPEGIILEDDCLPSPSFFRFCSDLLAHYRSVPQVMHVSGNSFQFRRRRGSASYYFSGIPNNWGWATWRRAWRHYDFNLRPAWELDDTWDTQWHLSIEKEGGLAIVPNVNLVSNIGFGSGATHTFGDQRLANLPAEEMRYPLIHPRSMTIDRSADTFTYYAHHRQVHHLHFIWMYQLMDILYKKLKPIKRRLLGPRP